MSYLICRPITSSTNLAKVTLRPPHSPSATAWWRNILRHVPTFSKTSYLSHVKLRSSVSLFDLKQIGTGCFQKRDTFLELNIFAQLTGCNQPLTKVKSKGGTILPKKKKKHDASSSRGYCPPAIWQSYNASALVFHAPANKSNVKCISPYQWLLIFDPFNKNI